MHNLINQDCRTSLSPKATCITVDYLYALLHTENTGTHLTPTICRCIECIERLHNGGFDFIKQRPLLIVKFPTSKYMRNISKQIRRTITCIGGEI